MKTFEEAATVICGDPTNEETVPTLMDAYGRYESLANEISISPTSVDLIDAMIQVAVHRRPLRDTLLNVLISGVIIGIEMTKPLDPT